MSKNIAKIFYAWQSDLPPACNRSFIQDALEQAVQQIQGDKSLEVEPTLDRDTLNVPGAPDIIRTILNKIDESLIFVADISITDPDSKRPSPNPNVMFELGYAVKSLGEERIILVFNTSFGAIDVLPFDIRSKRITPYTMPKTPPEQGRGIEKKRLTRVLEDAIRAILKVPIHQKREFPKFEVQEGRLSVNKEMNSRRKIEELSWGLWIELHINMPTTIESLTISFRRCTLQIEIPNLLPLTNFDIRLRGREDSLIVASSSEEVIIKDTATVMVNAQAWTSISDIVPQKGNGVMVLRPTRTNQEIRVTFDLIFETHNGSSTLGRWQIVNPVVIYTE